MRILFIVDPLENLKPNYDSSLFLAQAFQKQGCDVALGLAGDLFLLKNKAHISQTYSLGTFSMLSEKPQLLDQYDMIHFRKDPPYDTNYLFMTWICSHTSTPIVNDLRAIRNFNEKLLATPFNPPEFPTLVSNQAGLIRQFLEEHQECIAKPLGLFGGAGIEKWDEKTPSKQIQKTLASHGYLLVQPFLKDIYDQEIRAFYVCGQSVFWCSKKPEKGSFLANSNFGSTIHNLQPPMKEKTHLDGVAQSLLKDGIFIIGFDLIGGILTEVNITSPRLMFDPAQPVPVEAFDQSASLLLQWFE